MIIYQDFSPRMKWYAVRLALLLLAGLAASSFAFALSYVVSAWDTSANRIGPRQFSVSGEGKVSIKPDVVFLSAGVVTQAARIADAQDENTKRSNAVMEFLKKKGVAEKDIKTTGYNVSPQYEYAPPCVS